MTIANVVILSLAGICALAALFFLVRGIRARLSRTQQPYGVAQQEARHDMQVNLLRAGFMLIITLILLGIYGLVSGERGQDASPPPTPEVAATAATRATAEGTPEGTLAPPSATPTPSHTVLAATVTPTATATAEATSAPTVAVAVVNSPNGLWLREAPGGTQELELIAHQTKLELLPGRQTAEDLEWQQVRTPNGNEGWVASDFLSFP